MGIRLPQAGHIWQCVLYKCPGFGYNGHISMRAQCGPTGEVIAVEDATIKFTVYDDSSLEMKKILQSVYAALSEKGYHPVNQIVGYLLSEDPTYITNYNGARALICRLDRDELLQELVRHYLFD